MIQDIIKDKIVDALDTMSKENSSIYEKDDTLFVWLMQDTIIATFKEYGAWKATIKDSQVLKLETLNKKAKDIYAKDH